MKQRDCGLTIKGDVALVDDAPTDVNVEVKADQFWLSYTPAYQLRADGRVKVSGAYPALTVKGRVELMDSKVTLGEDFFAESSDLELDPVMAIHRKKGGSAAARAEEAGPDLVSQM
ncbi:MAG: translocation/assembly module TamB domain-containing protein, partial [bacterium]